MWRRPVGRRGELVGCFDFGGEGGGDLRSRGRAS